MNDTIQQIPLKDLYPSEGNRRVGGFDQAKLEQLAESIRAVGVQQPAIVRQRDKGGVKGGTYEIVCGDRRWRGAKIAGLEALPCVVRGLDDVQVLRIQTIENLQREDIHPLDEADGYARLIERAGYDVEHLAGEIGRSASYVYQRLKLRDLVEGARKMLVDGQMTAGHAILVARLPAKQQETLLKNPYLFPSYPPGSDIATVRKLDDEIHRSILLDLSKVSFGKDDADLVAKAGACTTCPKRTGFQPELFADVCKDDGKRDYCTDPPCFNKKLNAMVARRREEMEGKDYVKVQGSEVYGGWKPADVLSQWDAPVVKKGTPGAKLALVVSGKDRGKITYVRPKSQDPELRKQTGRDRAAKLSYQVEEELRNRLVMKIAEAEAAKIKQCGIPDSRLELILEGLAGDDLDDLLELNDWGDPASKETPTIADLHLTSEQLLLALFQLALVGFARRFRWDRKNARLDALAKEHGIDVAALKAQIRKELEEKDKSKPAQETAVVNPDASDDVVRKCRVCGCTDGDCHQCIERTGAPCHWVEDDLCSACVDTGLAARVDEALGAQTPAPARKRAKKEKADA